MGVQPAGRTSDERSRVQCLVPARSAGARHWTKSAPRFPATESPGTERHHWRCAAVCAAPECMPLLCGDLHLFVQKLRGEVSPVWPGECVEFGVHDELPEQGLILEGFKDFPV